MAKNKPSEKEPYFPQNECVVFGQLAPLPTRVHVSTSQAEKPKYEHERPGLTDGRNL